MNEIRLERDINAYYAEASSFPQGVLAAHKQLHALVEYDHDRNYFGISRPENDGSIVYRAAAEELVAGELSQHDLPVFVIRKGNYAYIDIENFMEDPHQLEKIFSVLISGTRVDPQGCCVEWYLDNDTCRCMVRLKDE